MAHHGVMSGAPVLIGCSRSVGSKNVDDHNHRWLLALAGGKHHCHTRPNALTKKERRLRLYGLRARIPSGNCLFRRAPVCANVLIDDGVLSSNDRTSTFGNYD